jgi:rRNA maturation RNase YbeY
MPVKFSYIEPFQVPNATRFKRFLEHVVKVEKRTLEGINYVFCSDEYLLQINQKFLKHNYLTDIITFDLSSGSAISSEIYISIDRVRENAMNYHTSIKKELYRVMIHGVLHLVGYKDKTKSESEKMRSKEEHYLQLFHKFRP